VFGHFDLRFSEICLTQDKHKQLTQHYTQTANNCITKAKPNTTTNNNNSNNTNNNINNNSNDAFMHDLWNSMPETSALPKIG
jgi:hypothetical protein